MNLLLRRLALVVGLTLAAAFLSACGGGDDDATEAPPTATGSAAPAAQETASPASPTAASPTATAEDPERAANEALLKAAALRLEDLPEGFTLDEESFSTNEEAASQSSDSPGSFTLADMNRFQRILGYDATYSNLEALTASAVFEGTLFLQTTATVYRNPDGAGEAFEFVRQQTSDAEAAQVFEESFAISAGVEVTNASILPVSIPELGDDRLAIEIRVSAHSADLDQDFDFVAQLVGVRRDRVIGSFTLVTVNGPTPQEELDDLTRKLDERMQGALG
jgi:hypothetical protein